MSNLYLVPSTISCEKCKQPISLKRIIEDQRCPFCAALQHKENYGKYFGVIKDIKDNK